MQVKTAITYITMALVAFTALHVPQVHGEEMTYYSQAAPVVLSSGKVISPARVKVMQNEQKILGRSPYAKAVGVDLSQVGSSAVPVVTPAPVPAPVQAPVSALTPVAAGDSTGATTPVAADASLSPERVEIIQMELKELGFSPHAEATGVDLKKASFVVPDSAAPSSTPAAPTTTTDASDPSTTATTTTSDVVQTGAGY